MRNLMGCDRFNHSACRSRRLDGHAQFAADALSAGCALAAVIALEEVAVAKTE
jgi:hypothetical protein